MIRLSSKNKKRGLECRTNVDTMQLQEGLIAEVMPASPSAIDYHARRSEEKIRNLLDSDFPHAGYKSKRKYQ